MLRAWTQAFSPGDPEALIRRLSWDDLDPDLVRAAADAAPADEDGCPESCEGLLSAWTEWLLRFGDGASSVRQDLAHGVLPELAMIPEGREPPFVEIWAAMLRAARSTLAERTGALRPMLTPAARAALECQLLAELSGHGELAVYDCYQSQLARAADPSADETRPAQPAPVPRTDAYRAFVLEMLDGRLEQLFVLFPVLARQIALVVDGWVESTAELLDRLASDRLRVTVDGTDPGLVAGIEPGLSDPHDGRRRVAALRFTSGLRIVYKPRDIRIERAYYDIVAWLVARGLDPALPAPRVVEGCGYGWVEYVDQEPFLDEAAVRRYYRQTGVLLLLTHLLGAKDLHMENLVATKAGPVLIDLELLVQPDQGSSPDHGSIPDQGSARDQVATDSSEPVAPDSCLRTALLTLVEIGAGDDVYDVGGLRGDGRMSLPVPRRIWRHLRSDAIHFVDEPACHAPVRNAVVLDRRRRLPDEYAAEVLDGFAAAYRFFQVHRHALVSDDGPLAALAEAAVRVIARPTNQYAMLGVVRNAPRYQRDGLVRSVIVDVLHRIFAGGACRPREWPLIVEERRAIEALDVPRFVVPADGRSVYAGGRLIFRDYYARSAIQAVRERLARLSDRDGKTQRLVLARALADSTTSRFGTPLPDDGPPWAQRRARSDSCLGEQRVSTAHADQQGEHLIDHAVWIARELLASATGRGDSMVWSTLSDLSRGETHFLYDGTIGPALFLAALAAITGAAEWRNAAYQAIAPALDWSEAPDLAAHAADAAIGGCAGLGSLAYGLGRAGAFLGDPRIRAAAERVAGLIDANRIAADRRFDVVGGAAGAVLGILALEADIPCDALRRVAVACGDHLVDSHVERGSAWAWPGPGGRRLAGFAHGAAGIATALARLYRVTGRRAYGDAARLGFTFVSDMFCQAELNWPIAAPDPRDTVATAGKMTAWCHGAPGIAMAGASAVDLWPDEPIVGQARLALGAMIQTLPWKRDQCDHLCCGHLGRADALLTAGSRLGLAGAEAAARELGERVLVRARKQQHFRLSAPGSFEYRVSDPGLFRGLSGIGYQLLRLARPEQVPSMTSFDAAISRTP